jgi:hypothetical protein
MIGFGLGFSSVFALPLAFGYDHDGGTACITLFVGPVYIEFLWGAR